MKKYLTPVLALVLVSALAIGGTLAYLTDTTEKVTNTFTAGENIGIDLKETQNGDGYSTEVTSRNDYKIIPGDVEAKDPFVRVDKDSEDVYIYVDVIENIGSGNVGDELTEKKFSDYIVYNINSNWKEVTGTNNAAGTTTYVYVGTETNPVAVSTGTKYYVLAGGESTNANGEVTYPTDITNEMLAAIDGKDNEVGTVLTDGSETAPTLTFKAYAIQADNLEASNANTQFISYFKKTTP